MYSRRAKGKMQPDPTRRPTGRYGWRSGRDVTALLRPLPADRLRIWPVERTVNTGFIGGATAGGATSRTARLPDPG